MSATAIYRLGRNPGLLGEAYDSWRSAMFVWDDIARRYFGLDRFPLPGSRNSVMKDRIWNAEKHVSLPSHEITVLHSTLDNAVAPGLTLDSILVAFSQYGNEHPRSSLRDQADIIARSGIKPQDYIAWNQTTVNQFWGVNYYETGRTWYYNPAKSTDHFLVRVA